MTYAERAIRYKIAGEMAKILLIEDEELVRNTLCDVLQLAGHDVDEADNGATGTMLHKTQSYDLVITDIIMPDKEASAQSSIFSRRTRRRRSSPSREADGWAPRGISNRLRRSELPLLWPSRLQIKS